MLLAILVEVLEDMINEMEFVLEEWLDLRCHCCVFEHWVCDWYLHVQSRLGKVD